MTILQTLVIVAEVFIKIGLTFFPILVLGAIGTLAYVLIERK